MRDILTFCDIKKDFERLGIEVRRTYSGKIYSVCEVTDEEFKTLCEEPDIEGTWDECGWRFAKGSVMGVPYSFRVVNKKKLRVWRENRKFKCKEYEDLLTYFNIGLGASQPRNVCALATDLAKYNNMKMSELFRIYQG